MRITYGIGLRWLTASALILGVGTVDAAVKFEPEISVGIAHTDNLELTTTDPTSETVYKLLPAFKLEQESARFSSKMDYRVEGYYYKNRSDSDAYQFVDANLRAALDPDNFFIDFDATRQQVIRDAAAPLVYTNLSITTNRLEQNELSVTPNFRYAFGENATTTGSLRHSHVRFDDSPTALLVRDYDEDEFDYSIDNYRKLAGFTWAVRFNDDKTDYGIVAWETRTAAVEFGTWVGARMRIFASGGKETPWDSLEPSLDDSFWEVGAATRETDKFTAEFAIGDRSFGSTRRGRLNMKLNNGTTGFSYSEEPSTLGRDSYRDALPVAQQSGDLLLRPGQTERFLLKRLQWDLAVKLGRTDLTLRLFDENREGRTTLEGAPLADEAQSGGSVTALYHVGFKTDLILRLDRAKRDVGDGNDRDYSLEALGANYRLGTRTRLSFEYAHSQDEAELGFSGFNYDANLVTLMATRTF